MIRSNVFILSLILTCSFISVQAQSPFRSALIGKKVSETPLSEYIQQDIHGDQLILLIAYGCSHCQKATQKALRLRNTSSIDNFIVLGSEAEETNTKAEFMATIADEDIKVIDYEWTTFPRKFTIPEPGFPNPPVIFYVQNNVIMNIMTDVPDKANYKKSAGK
ncbi:MAG TPA: hypothetical protein PLL00_11570 [Bacteroidia bacterium]|nr:hypothetical protein [Bacteroidia bacterium]